MKGVFEMILATAALGTAFLVSGCFGGAPKLTEPGVSMELARERASRISGLSSSDRLMVLRTGIPRCPDVKRYASVRRGEARWSWTSFQRISR